MYPKCYASGESAVPAAAAAAALLAEAAAAVAEAEFEVALRAVYSEGQGWLQQLV